jgi:hypothetical protein
VPLFRDFFKFGIAVNGFQQLITVGTSQRPERMQCTIASLHGPGAYVALVHMHSGNKPVHAVHHAHLCVQQQQQQQQ